MNNTFVLSPSIPIFKKIVPRVKFTKKMFLVFSAILITSLFTSCIIQVNSLAKETYQIQDYQQRISELSQENEKLLFDALKISSLSNIETIVNNSNFEKTQKIHYIQVSGTQVVTR